MDVGHALTVLWPRVWILIASGLVAGAAAFAATGLVAPTFESQATLLVGQSSGAPPVVYEDLLAAQILANTYAELSTTTPVLAAARDEANLSISIEDLRRQVHAEGSRNSPLIVITTIFRDPDEAARVANAIAEETAAIGAGGSDRLHVSLVDPAEASTEPVAPRPLFTALAGGGLAVLVSAGIVLLAFGRIGRPPRHASIDGGRDAIPAVREAR